MLKIFFFWAHFSLQLGYGRQAGTWLSGTIHRIDLQKATIKQDWDLQEHLMFQFLLKDQNSTLYWNERVLKSNYNRRPKPYWCTLYAYSPGESFLQLFFLYFVQMTVLLVHSSQCLSLPCTSSWKKDSYRHKQERNLQLVLQAFQKTKSLSWPLLMNEWLCTFMELQGKEKKTPNG